MKCACRVLLFASGSVFSVDVGRKRAVAMVGKNSVLRAETKFCAVFYFTLCRTCGTEAGQHVLTSPRFLGGLYQDVVGWRAFARKCFFPRFGIQRICSVLLLQAGSVLSPESPWGRAFAEVGRNDCVACRVSLLCCFLLRVVSFMQNSSITMCFSFISLPAPPVIEGMVCLS